MSCKLETFASSYELKTHFDQRYLEMKKVLHISLEVRDQCRNGLVFAYRAFKGQRRVLRSVPSGWIDNKECARLINGASKILASSVSLKHGVILLLLG